MRCFDLSQPLFDNCPNCPAHPPVSLPILADHPLGGWRLEGFHMASHSGTHLDAPLHKLAAGASIDQLPLHAFIGPPHVASLTHLHADDPITGEDLALTLKDHPSLEGGIVLLNTGWGLKRARTEEWLRHSPFLTPDGARWLVSRKVKGVGIDHYSIGGSRDPENTRTHEILLGAGIWVVEDLCFRNGWRDALQGKNTLFQALPLLLPGFSGSPCRAVFIY